MISFGNVVVEYKVDISKVKFFFFQMVNKYRYKKLEIRIISSPPPSLRSAYEQVSFDLPTIFS